VAELLGFPGGAVGLRVVADTDTEPEADTDVDAEVCGATADAPVEAAVREPAAFDAVAVGSPFALVAALAAPETDACAVADGVDLPEAENGISVSGETGPPSRLQITSSE